jgi:hypothetical protein
MNILFSKHPWIFSKRITMHSWLGKIFGLIWMAAMVCFLVAAWGLFIGQDCWTNYAIYGSFLSLVAILPWVKTVVPGALYGY